MYWTPQFFRHRFFRSVFSVTLWLVAFSSAHAADPTYWDDVRPVLRKHCTACHSQRTIQEADVSGGLALDSYDAVLKAKKPILKPGKSGDSAFIQLLVTKDEEKRMPRSSKPLETDKIELLRRWVDTGAKEGKKPDDTMVATTAPSTTPKKIRKLDVNLATNAVPPAGILGKAAPAKLELALKVGPLSPVTAVAFSPDNKLLATGTYGRVVVWDLATAKPVKVLTNVLGAVNDLRFSPDGKLLAVAGGQPSAKGDLRLYQVADWKLLGTFGGHEDVVFSICFSNDGKQIASASFDKTVHLWNVADFKLIRSFTDHSDFVYSVTFSPDGKYLLSASKDRTVKIVEVATGKAKLTFGGFEQDILAVAISPDGKNAVSSGFESNLFWWDPLSGKRLKSTAGHGGGTYEICFSKDGKLIVSCGADGTAKISDAASGTLKTSLAAGSAVYAVALRQDAKQVATGSYDGLVRLWDANAGRLLVTLLSLPPEGEKFEWLAVTPEGYAAGSPGLDKLGQWKMSGQAVAFDAVWKALQQPDSVAKAVRGEAVPALTWK